MTTPSLSLDDLTALKELLDAGDLNLIAGVGNPAEGRACAMSLVAWRATGEITDHPACVHPLIADHIIRLNDRQGATKESRWELVENAGPVILGTATGSEAHAATTGSEAHAATTGDNSIAAALNGGYARAGIDGTIVVAYLDKAGKRRLAIAYVGENDVHADTWYRATVTGELEAVPAHLCPDASFIPEALPA